MITNHRPAFVVGLFPDSVDKDASAVSGLQHLLKRAMASFGLAAPPHREPREPRLGGLAALLR